MITDTKIQVKKANNTTVRVINNKIIQQNINITADRNVPPKSDVLIEG